MSDWTGIILLQQSFVNYFVGDLGLVLLALVVFFTGMLLAVRVSPLFSLVIPTPVYYVMAKNGYFAEAWPAAIILLLLSIIWAFILWRLTQ